MKSEILKLLNEMTKEELVNCIMQNNIFIYDKTGIYRAKHYLTSALLYRMKKSTEIETEDITKAKTTKEMLKIMDADEKKYKKWEKINKRLEELQNM
ncbi:hypothetical protein FDB24_10580 [Clostridium botulinum]|uniref:hypothetical protein n=1 Tax=Clostridium botulinum TaxID=1491 RepID=UPI0007748360|nr:hypothetical protein [Clostridium botulinum]NFL87370.1 hypothetical protein [Clostridium botulinum]NFO21707.1 hypothetical protein [Clostridium botulinum]